MANAVKSKKWKIAESLDNSKKLLQYTLAGDELSVAKGIENVHEEETSILSYNDENSLSCVISIAYYAAKNDYIFHRELPTGKGFADIVLLPRPGVASPALIIELKINETADNAIKQIKENDYINKVKEHTDRILLVGICYDKKCKKHTCKIEKSQLLS